MKYDNVQVTLLVAGKEAKEHQIRTDFKNDVRRLTSYVESADNLPFGVAIFVQGQLDCEALSFNVSVDGTLAASAIAPRSHDPREGTKRYIDGFRKIRGQIVTVRKFRFAKINLRASFSSTLSHISSRFQVADTKQAVDEKICTGSNVSGLPDLKKLGSVLVTVYRVSLEKLALGPTDNDQLELGCSNFNEELLKGKGLSHCTSLGPEETFQSRGAWKTRCDDSQGKPVLVFRFKYRSHEELQNLGIFNEPAESASPSILPADTDNLERIRGRLIAQIPVAVKSMFVNKAHTEDTTDIERDNSMYKGKGKEKEQAARRCSEIDAKPDIIDLTQED
ncbi:hypothetical protein BP6252_06909 [Coleophoma cylindrospora]|uniref:DUF7918 domain-containing protein n=1 Tax=Coleophoma cylindrospora TaxID=1849047 RepID=A0A3D8RG36_9HELO|nr:hypothetical protein BP6252_06909 [Coleophoma cylindrospora]